MELIKKTIKDSIFFAMRISLSLCFTLSSPVYGQIFDYEQTNPNIKWKQINTSTYRLIFPEAFSPKAIEVAKNIELQLQEANKSFDRKARKIDIVVQENTLDQNGFVQLAPRKSELFATPSGVADNQAWLSSLSLHETRHVAQFDNLVGNFRKPLGQQIGLALFGLNLPSWYYEGDAVLHETLYSNGGRGRLPSWDMPIRTFIQSNMNFDFNKYVHGSFKDLVPSYYTIGYFMNSELYNKDPNNTGYIFKNMRNKLLRPFNFQLALKKYYGDNANGLFKNTISNLQSDWKNKNTNPYPNRIAFQDKYPTSYLLPQVVNESLYAIKQGPQHVNSIVKVNMLQPETYHEVLKLGAQLMPYFDLKNNLLVWDEYRRNARFSKETFNVINIYDLNNNKKRTITHQSRYYTPTISPDLKHIACIEVDEANNSYLIILDIATGDKVNSIAVPQGIHIQQPQYHASGKKLITIAVSEEGTSLGEINLNTQRFSILLPWGNQQIERPIYHEDHIVYKSNLTKKDDIFKLKNGKIYQLTEAEFGAFNPYINNNKLFFNDYTADGYKINSIDLTDLEETPTNEQFIETLYTSQNEFINTSTDTSTTSNFKIENYNMLAHAINFHSISISGNDFESLDNLKPGIYLLSNDVLNTTQTKLGFEYDTNIKKTSYSAEISYQKYYPKFNVGYKNVGQIGFAASSTSTDSVYQFDYRENIVTLNMQLPFVQNKGNKIYAYGLNFGTSYQHRYNVSLPLKNFNTAIVLPLNYQIYFNLNARKSRMDLLPRWGQNFSFLYRHLPFEKDLGGHSWSFRTTLYFPGIATNHGVQLRYAMQENSGKFSNSIDIPLISGIAYLPYQNIKNTLILEYRLPLAYPDLSIGPLAYIKRIYGSVSANYLNIQHSTGTPQAISASLFFDFNVFKYNLPNFNFEAKASYLTPQYIRKRIFPEFALSYNY